MSALQSLSSPQSLPKSSRSRRSQRRPSSSGKTGQARGKRLKSSGSSSSKVIALPRLRRTTPFLGAAIEASAKLAINMMLCTVSISALARILPYHLTQQERLQALRLEVQSVQDRVDQLRADFNWYFDPQQTRSVMQQYRHRVDPNRLQVVWVLDRPSARPAKPADR